MRNALRNAGLLLSTLALVAVPHAASGADTRPTPPKGCASTQGYSSSGNERAKLTVCFTQEWYKPVYGDKRLEPTDVITANCSNHNLWWRSTGCSVTAKLTLKKNGVHVWTENRAWGSDPVHGRADGRYVDHYACRGHGEYSLTLHDATASVNTTGGVRRAHVTLKPVTVKATGC
ncbi:hypothetical protein ACSNOK_11005 [Streptomyces sp. URMC 126]|uniref:hypothetical protein n=1 Tax=Streptomyces sp. URMC 126 TaxID=3423401 RepID=UPI003F1AC471